MAQGKAVKERDKDVEDIILLLIAGSIVLSLASAGIGIALGIYIGG